VEVFVPAGRVRAPGGGRKSLREADSGLVPALLALVEPDQRSDPESPLLWTVKSTRKLAAELTRQGHRVGSDTVAALLKAEGFSLQGTSRTTEGAPHPDRDAQFHYINDQVKAFLADGQPVVGVDAKKKETLGDYAVIGSEWRRAGQPVEVRAHDFPEKGARRWCRRNLRYRRARARHHPQLGWTGPGTREPIPPAAFALRPAAQPRPVSGPSGGGSGRRRQGTPHLTAHPAGQTSPRPRRQGHGTAR
jgi:hypothetical protein